MERGTTQSLCLRGRVVISRTIKYCLLINNIPIYYFGERCNGRECLLYDFVYYTDNLTVKIGVCRCRFIAGASDLTACFVLFELFMIKKAEQEIDEDSLLD